MLILISIYAIYAVLKIYISVQEIFFIKKAKLREPVILNKENFVQAGDYKIENERLSIIMTIFDLILFVFWVTIGLSFIENLLGYSSLIDYIFVEFEFFSANLIRCMIFLFAFFAINYILKLPIGIYSVFVKEKKYGFSNITPKIFIIDQLKTIALLVVIMGFLFYGFAYFTSLVNNSWIWVFVGCFALVILINVFFTTLIAPMYNKFTPLENNNLKESILKMMQAAGLSSSGIFVVDAKKRDNRLNAYFGGLGKTKRVVLFDTLLEKLSDNELLAVLGHELGHFKHKDILKNLVMTGCLLFVIVYSFSELAPFVSNQIDVNPLFSIVAIGVLFLPIMFFIYMPIFGLLSRHNEFKADEYGAQCQSKEDLKLALMKLADENKYFPYSHPLYVAFYSTHPPMMDRIAKLEQ